MAFSYANDQFGFWGLFCPRRMIWMVREVLRDYDDPGLTQSLIISNMIKEVTSLVNLVKNLGQVLVQVTMPSVTYLFVGPCQRWCIPVEGQNNLFCLLSGLRLMSFILPKILPKKLVLYNLTDTTHRVWNPQKMSHFNVASEASYVYILSGQNVITNAKKWSILASFF